MLANWLVSTDMRAVKQAELELFKTQQQVVAQKWLLKKQTQSFFRRKDTLLCVFLAGCLKGFKEGESQSSSSSLIGTAFTLFRIASPLLAGSGSDQ
ncbi:hypothetical protein [Flavobacterium sp. W21_SRS_FM6]|uniref:hypothetical protein n=1 Tax=Flavobacterium sp. W21_SRS_FM6 TaxID=3240268 RepID=UPI003F933D73